MGRQGSRVSMRVARASASLLSSHGRGIWPVLSSMLSALMTAPEMSTLRRTALLYIETPSLRALMVQGPRSVSVRAAMRGKCGGRALWALWQ